MYRSVPVPSLQRTLNRHATTLMICGIFMSFSAVMFLSMCSMSDSGHTHDTPSANEQGDDSLWPAWKPKQQPIKREKAFLVVMVLTGPKNLERRNAIRETWLSEVPSDVKRIFVVGTTGLRHDTIQDLENEHWKHKDLVMLKNLNESYGLLTDKVMKSLVWIDHHIDFQFLFKADDDTFAKMDVITRELHRLTAERLYWGFFDGRANVKRKGKWRENDWILCDLYLPHARGGGYILSADLVHFVAANSKYLKKFRSEDISMGTWLAPLDIKRFHDPRFDTEYRSRGCLNSYIVTHKQSVSQMKEKYKNLKEHGKMCVTQTRTRYSYVYNWKAPPSQCCIRNNTKIP